MDLRIFNIDSRCTGCGACVSICPKSCLSLMPNKEGFYYPQTTNEACIECGLCSYNCPSHIDVTENVRKAKRVLMMKKK